MLHSLLLLLAVARADEPVARLTLDEALDRFRAEAPTSAVLAARVAEARAQARLATTPLQPVLAVQGAYVRNDREVVLSFADVLGTLQDSLPVKVAIDPAALPEDRVLQPLQQVTGTASLQVPLIAPSAWYDLAAARRQADAVASRVDGARLDAEAALVRGAWLADAAEVLRDAAAHAEATAERHLASAERQRDAGLGTDLDVQAARTELLRRRSDRLQADEDVARAQRALAALLGVPGRVDVDLPAPAAADLDVERLLRRAADHPDVAAARSTVDASRAAVASARWRHAPTLSASAQVLGSSSELINQRHVSWRVGGQLSWVLYDGGARYGLLDVGRARRAGAEAALAQVALDADREARDAIAAVQVADARLALARAALETAGTAEASAERAYDAGLLSGTDLLDALQRRTDAAAGVAAALARLGAARAELGRATGTGRSSP